MGRVQTPGLLVRVSDMGASLGRQGVCIALPPSPEHRKDPRISGKEQLCFPAMNAWSWAISLSLGFLTSKQKSQLTQEGCFVEHVRQERTTAWDRVLPVGSIQWALFPTLRGCAGLLLSQTATQTPHRSAVSGNMGTPSFSQGMVVGR